MSTAQDLRALYERVEALKRARGMPWWLVAVEVGIGPDALQRLRYGTCTGHVHDALVEWLHRHTAPFPTTHEIKQGGNDDDSGGSGG
ncbi:hypothetical protein AB0J35_57940 [Nonomuraea angiospora]|uniref:hypothetical protein n=1 Tax=Nonomuraea angiospora TaxID=46172 RepID=UPI003442CC26